MSAVEWTDADLARSIYADEEVQQAIATVVNEVPEALVSRAHIADLTLRTVAPFVAAREAQAWDDGFDAGHQAARAVNPEWPGMPRNPHRIERGESGV